jgi:hypothetical protein
MEQLDLFAISSTDLCDHDAIPVPKAAAEHLPAAIEPAVPGPEPQASAPDATATAPMRTLADLLARVESWTDLPPARRRVLEDGVMACAAVLGRNLGIEHAPPSGFPADVGWLNRHLFLSPPRAYRLAPGSFGNYVSLLRRCLRRPGMVEADGAAMSVPAQGPWPVLLSTLNGTFAVLGLQRFAAWCDERGITPEAVTAEVIASFEDYMAQRPAAISPPPTGANPMCYRSRPSRHHSPRISIS